MSAPTAYPRLWCCFHSHLSFRRVGEAVAELLAPCTRPAAHPGEADVALLATSFDELLAMQRPLPALSSCTTIAMIAWETLEIPARGRRALALVDEVWAPSAWCQQVLAAAHPRVEWLPHPVPPPPPTLPPLAAQEAALIAKIQAWAGGRAILLAVGAPEDQRKNIRGLRRAFAAVARQLPEACLIIKSLPERSPSGLRTRSHWALMGPQEASLAAHLSDAGMDHLYAASAALVSAHHAEGWGLALSDAMARGLPVVATFASGNTDFMTPFNSLPVSASVARVGRTDANFRAGSRWYKPHPESLQRQLVAAVKDRGTPARLAMLAQARADIAAFAPERVGQRARERLAATAGQRGKSRRPV